MISSALIASIRWRKRIATRSSGSAPEEMMIDIVRLLGKCAAMFFHSITLRRLSSGSCAVEVAGDGDLTDAMWLRKRAHSISTAAIDRRCKPTQLPARINATTGKMNDLGFNSLFIGDFTPPCQRTLLLGFGLRAACCRFGQRSLLRPPGQQAVSRKAAAGCRSPWFQTMIAFTALAGSTPVSL